MSYKQLFDHCQNLPIAISRNAIKAKLLEITGKEKLPVVLSRSLRAKDCRGLFLSVESNSDWVRQNGSDVVVLSHEIFNKTPNGNMCMERFIIVKEMMHLFDVPEEMCDTGDEFDNLVQLFLQTTSEFTPQFNSEVDCFWKALGLLCPQDKIPEFQNELDNRGETDVATVYYDIALRLRIPQQYVPHLFTDRYRKNIASLCGE